MILWAEPKDQVIWIIRLKVMAPNKSGLLAPAHGWVGDFGVKNDQKVLHNMIFMSEYKERHSGKKGKKIRARPPPPFSGNARKKSIFSMGGVP